MGSKTDHICDELEKRIASGQWQEGDKIPPFSSMMNEFNVSKGIIQYAIGKLSTRGFVYTVQGQGTFVGMDKSKKLDEIVVLLMKSSSVYNFLYPLDPNNETPMRTQKVLSGAQREATANKLKIIYSEIDAKNIEQNSDLLLSYNSGNILGMVIVGPITPELRPILRKAQYPVVLTCDLADPRHKIIHEIDIVTDDIHLSSVIATEKLLEAGHRKIKYISSRPIIGWSGLFHTGWKSAIAGIDIEPHPDDCVLPQIGPNQTLYEAGHSLAPSLAKDKNYTACFIPEDNLALGVLEGLMEYGVDVPNEMSISAIVDRTVLSNRYNLKISAIRSSAFHIGRSAVHRVLETRKYGSNPGRHTVVGMWQDGDTIANINP